MLYPSEETNLPARVIVHNEEAFRCSKFPKNSVNKREGVTPIKLSICNLGQIGHGEEAFIREANDHKSCVRV